jgi:DNA-binding GntR family transcriptional regulator
MGRTATDRVVSLNPETKVINAAAIAAELEEEIALGLLAPRERLVEEDLVKRFRVTRHMIRQSLALLDELGIVVRHPNRGASVKHFSLLEVEQFYVVRGLLESFAAKLIPLPAPASVVAQLSEIHSRYCGAVKRGDLRRVFRENLLFHKTMFAACGNKALTEAIEQLQFKTHSIRSYSISNPKILASVCKQHGRMLDLLRSNRRPEFVELLASHILPAKERYLERFAHTARSAAPRRTFSV